VPVELAGVLDSRGRATYSVAARHIPDERADQLHDKELDDEDRLLVAMQMRAGGSLRDFAMHCGWTNGLGKPLVNRVQSRMRAMQKKHIVEQDRKDKWRLTSRGQKEADQLK